MKKSILPVLLGCAFAAGAGTPVIRDSSVTVPDSAFQNVEISYALDGEPAVVTVDIRTNGVSVGEAAVANVQGDVNRLVQPGEGKRITWKARAGFPDHDFRSREVTAVVRAWPTNNPPDYAVFDLTAPYAVRYYVSTNALPFGGLANRRVYCREKVVLRKIAAAGRQFRMGGKSSQYGAAWAYHTVHLSQDYYMAIYQMTIAQLNRFWDGGTFSASGYAPAEELPAAYKAARNQLRGASDPSHADYAAYQWPQQGHAVGATSKFGIWRARTGLRLDFPTDAQWEFACRAGTTGNYYYSGSNLNDVNNQMAWYGWLSPYDKYYPLTTNATTGVVTANSTWGALHPVGLKPANPNGLYDMYGNCWDECLDWFSNTEGWFLHDYHDPMLDPMGVGDAKAYNTRGTYGRVMRGGAYENGPGDSCSPMRFVNGNANVCGIRLTCPACAVK